MSKSRKYSPRGAAALALKSVFIQKQSLDNSILPFSKTLASNDLGLLKALCFGVLRHYRTLDATVAALLDKPLRNKDYDVYALILIGAYQLQAMRMPEYAAIDSVVKASKELQKPWASGLINAVLRKLQKADAVDFTANITSEHPDWLYQSIKTAWPEQADAIFTANNQEPPLCLRVNQARISREDYLALLTQQGYQASAGQLSSAAIYLHSKPDDVTQLPHFVEGYCSVQDEAAQMAAFLLDAQPSMRVLDACAAPGGKTCHILEREAALDLLAVDIDEQRLTRVQENLARLNLTASLKAADIQVLDTWWDGQLFDRILCDVPCSATGVIRRHPDIKFLRQAPDIAALAERQLAILQAMWGLLKPDGILLYATCSILPQENSEIIQQFCQQNSDCHVTNIALPSLVTSQYGWQLLPNDEAHDGFYYARLQKRTTL